MGKIPVIESGDEKHPDKVKAYTNYPRSPMNFQPESRYG